MAVVLAGFALYFGRVFFVPVVFSVMLHARRGHAAAGHRHRRGRQGHRVLLGSVEVLLMLVMWALGMPDPLIWGLLTATAELVPYIGGFVLTTMFVVTALTTFDSVAYALLVPASYLLISALQNNLVTPWLFGARLRLNPVILLAGVLLWWFLWGVPGAFLAIPMIAMFKAFCNQTPKLQRVGEFLGA